MACRKVHFLHPSQIAYTLHQPREEVSASVREQHTVATCQEILPHIHLAK